MTTNGADPTIENTPRFETSSLSNIHKQFVPFWSIWLQHIVIVKRVKWPIREEMVWDGTRPESTLPIPTTKQSRGHAIREVWSKCSLCDEFSQTLVGLFESVFFFFYSLVKMYGFFRFLFHGDLSSNSMYLFDFVRLNDNTYLKWLYLHFYFIYLLIIDYIF